MDEDLEFLRRSLSLALCIYACMSVIFELIFHLLYLTTKQIEEQKENDEISRLALNANHHRSTMKIMMMNLIRAIDESSISLKRGHVGGKSEREREEIDA